MKKKAMADPLAQTEEEAKLLLFGLIPCQHNSGPTWAFKAPKTIAQIYIYICIYVLYIYIYQGMLFWPVKGGFKVRSGTF